ncbi:MAG: type II toxin-antitoxin system PemK/MazF family toxin [bacterium]
MKRCEVWWADLPKPAGKRPVLLLSRNEAYFVRELVTIAPLTTRVRDIPVEVLLDKSDGVPKKCVANLDMITTIEKRFLIKKICLLSERKIKEINRAIGFALGIED